MKARTSMAILCVITIVLLSVEFTSHATAEEPHQSTSPICVGYLPGDAYFKIKIPLNDVENLISLSPYETEEYLSSGSEPTVKEITFEYDPPKISLANDARRLVGFHKCRVTDFNAEADAYFQLAIMLASEHSDRRFQNAYQDEGGIDESEITVLIVNRDFQFDKFRLLVRYNDIWNFDALPPEEKNVFQKLAVQDFGRLLYQPHVWHPEAVIEDGYHSREVSSLKVTFPQFADNLEALPVDETALEISFEEIAIVVVPTRNLFEIFKDPIEQTLYIAKRDGLYRFRHVIGLGKPQKVIEKIETR